MGFPGSQEALATRAQQPVTPHSQMGGGQGLGSKGHLPIQGDSITIHLSMSYLLGSWPQRGSGGQVFRFWGHPAIAHISTATVQNSCLSPTAHTQLSLGCLRRLGGLSTFLIKKKFDTTL